MANKLIVAPAPHVHGSESTQKIMRDVLLALTPALVFSVVAFGWSALAVTCVSVASCLRSSRSPPRRSMRPWALA
jgi:electron transport complex protein RnfD